MELNRSEKAIIKRCLKGCAKNNHPELNGAIPVRLPYYSDDQLYAFTNMQWVLVSDDPGEFPIIDEPISKTIEHLFDSFRNFGRDVIDVDPERVKEDKAKRKEEKSAMPYPIDTDKGKVYLKHDWLLDSMRFCECNGIYVDENAKPNNGNYLSPVYIDDGINRHPSSRWAMIFPVNCGAKKEKEWLTI